MTDQSDTSDSADLPEHFAEQLQKLDTQQLRETIHFAQKLLNRRLQSIPEQIEADDEDIVRVEERPEYTLVVRREPPGLVLYHVTSARDPDGGETLNWRYIGPVVED